MSEDGAACARAVSRRRLRPQAALVRQPRGFRDHHRAVASGGELRLDQPTVPAEPVRHRAGAHRARRQRRARPAYRCLCHADRHRLGARHDGRSRRRPCHGAVGARPLDRHLDGSALFPIPKIALLPLLILWLGIGEPSKIVTIALGVFFPTTIATYSGVDAVPRTLIRMAQSFDLPFGAIVRKDRHSGRPAVDPLRLSHLRLDRAAPCVAAEMIGADRGIGAFVLQAGNLMQTGPAACRRGRAVDLRADCRAGDRAARSPAPRLALSATVSNRTLIIACSVAFGILPPIGAGRWARGGHAPPIVTVWPKPRRHSFVCSCRIG